MSAATRTALLEEAMKLLSYIELEDGVPHVWPDPAAVASLQARVDRLLSSPPAPPPTRPTWTVTRSGCTLCDYCIPLSTTPGSHLHVVTERVFIMCARPASGNEKGGA